VPPNLGYVISWGTGTVQAAGKSLDLPERGDETALDLEAVEELLAAAEATAYWNPITR